jgi:signal transduction histidine kinase
VNNPVALPKFVNLPGGKLSRRLLLMILACSTLFTLAATSLQLYLEYRDDLTRVNENVEFIEASYVPALARSLYELNDKQLSLQLNGALQLNDVVYLKVVERFGGETRFTEVGSTDYLDMTYDEFDLVVELNDTPFKVGSLVVGSTTDNIMQQVLSKATQILTINAMKTFVVALIILAIIQWTVTRHIVAMASWANQFSLDHVEDKPFKLDRLPDETDELSQVADAVNKMQRRIATDLTAREALETETRQLAQDLHHAEKLQAIGELAGGMAHDFNNQLHIILANTELMREKHAHSPDVIAYTDNIIRSCLTSSELIESLMTFSRKPDNQITEVHMNKVIEEISAILRLGASKTIRIEVNTTASNDLVNGDESLIQNAFLNMGLNARDAMPKGGTLSLQTENIWLKKGQFAMGPAEAGTFIRTSMIDTGEGIEEDNLKRIFEPFFTTKAIGKGTGMGLAAVYGTVRAHNAIIEVKSTPGVATRFDLYFPLANSGAV